MLEATKIVSHVRFTDMVDNWSSIDDPEELTGSKNILGRKTLAWSFLRMKQSTDPAAIELGRQVHQQNCADCHARQAWSFLSYPAALALKPAALKLTAIRFDTILWYIHFLLCFTGLALLPFSKFFHILAGPLSNLVNSVISPQTFPANMATKQALEIDACTRCKTCSQWCSVVTSFAEVKRPDVLPSQRIVTLRKLSLKKHISPEELVDIHEGTYACTLCGRCNEVCPVHIGLRDLWIGLREELVRRESFPIKLKVINDAITQEHNVMEYPNDERAMWVEFLDDPPDDLYIREQAEVVYFVGCVSSFTPSVQSIPEAFCNILTTAGIDFTILGGEEWCCGFPLHAAGFHSGQEELKKHNIQAVRNTGAGTVVFSCPSCYYTWSHEYKPEINDLKLIHAAEYLDELIGQGKIKPTNPIQGTAAYHDPCDLGRNSGIYNQPRRVIQSLPGLSLVEIPENHNKSLCCGGGGDVETSDAALTAKVAAKRAKQISRTGANICVTACQQCVRTIKTGVAENDEKIEVLDIIELVWRSIS